MEKADPISDSVSERTGMRSAGAILGTCDEGEAGGRLMKAGERFAARYASARRSSTMVFNSRTSSSMSNLVFRRLGGREDGAVFERERDGDGRRERIRGGEAVPYVCARRSIGGLRTPDSTRPGGSSDRNGSVEGASEVGIEYVEDWLWALSRRDREPTAFL
jgi:hypothetical protein